MTDKKTVAQLREERGYSREQLAATMGIPYSTLVNIELFRNKPRAELLEQFYIFFKVPVGTIQWSKPETAANHPKKTPQAA